ncbi:MAG TPA: hypothetical protein VE441_14915, partial [Mycobacterium sp.]|nr:hypothetical protein [Mycobacterium sp.]
STTFGNAATARPFVDGFSNFTIIDDAATAPDAGRITALHYYAADAGHLRFVTVDPAGTVDWISDEIAPQVGANVFTPPVPVPVRAGDRVGIYSVGSGVIPYDFNADPGPDPFTANHDGLPTVGETLTIVGSTDRDYSYNADEESCTFTVGDPINADGSSVFRAKRGVVPVKLVGCPVSALAPTITVSRTSGSNPGSVDEVSSVSAADTGTTMRYDPSTGQYVYNLSLSAFGVGSYTVTITVNGIAVATATFGVS